MNKHEIIYDILYNLEDDYAMVVLNNYWILTGLSMRLHRCDDDLDEFLTGYTPTEILEMGDYAGYTFHSDYFTADGYDSIDSFYEGLSIEDFEDLDELADYIIEHNDSLGDDDIRDALKEDIA